MLISLILGAATVWFWFAAGLAQVTTQEYAVIIVPIQLTLGLTVASIFQAWFEEDKEVPANRRPPVFERGLDGKLTREGMTQAFGTLVKSESDMKVLKEIMAAAGGDGNEKLTNALIWATWPVKQ